MSQSGKIEAGYFAKKQIHSKDKLIAWSHLRRFETGLAILETLKPKRLLDYGSGDGTFLAMLSEKDWAPRESVGAELDPNTLADCQRRFRDVSGIQFCSISELADEPHRDHYDTVVCMEVLEHVHDLDLIISELDRALAPNGKIAISVPVETGLPVLVKQTARRVAGWRNLGDYKRGSRYSVRDLWKSVVAGADQHMVRPVFGHPDSGLFHDHTGFNWRYLRSKLEAKFEIERTIASPIAALGPRFASQVWLVGRKRT